MTGPGQLSCRPGWIESHPKYGFVFRNETAIQSAGQIILAVAGHEAVHEIYKKDEARNMADNVLPEQIVESIAIVNAKCMGEHT